ncbi:MAG TPA: hypothetical protein PLL98_04400 [Bacillota bacterium]|nr:hypothetical protein [Bacillota bacterium]HOR85710.1 hypothetical protein [Bacillota bacterium]HPL54308.1 hypothetical protein [Bacillota bacterium]
MFKKLLVSVIIITAVFLAGSAVYAQSEMKNGRDNLPVFELRPDSEGSKTFGNKYSIKGSASEGTKVTIDLYWFRTADKKSIIARKKALEDSEKEGDWIFQQTSEFKVGASGIFAESVELNLGLNKIVLFIKDVNGNTDEITLEMERFLEKQASEEVSGITINKTVENISNSINAD